MDFLFSMLFAIYFFIVSAAHLPVAFALWLLAPAIDHDRRILNRLSNWYMYRVLTISPFWRFTYKGLDNLPKGPCVMVANHQSFADIVVLAALSRPFRWVSKESVFYVPIFGWIMYLNGHISLRRGDLASTRQMFRACRRVLEQGVSLMMFPEGTRSLDGHLQPFKDGPFRLAMQTGVPIVPIAITGTRSILAKGANKLSFRAEVTIEVLPPVAVAEFADSNDMKEKVQAMIAEVVERQPAEELTLAA